MTTARAKTKDATERQIKHGRVFVRRSPSMKSDGNRIADAWEIIGRDHIGEFVIGWDFSRDESLSLAHRISELIVACGGDAGGKPSVQENEP